MKNLEYYLFLNISEKENEKSKSFADWSIEYSIYNETCCEVKNVSVDCVGLCKDAKDVKAQTRFNLPFNSCSNDIEIIKSCLINKPGISQVFFNNVN